MDEAQEIKGEAFKDLHSGEGIFVMPNAWSAGSACMLEAAGFPALGTTSAGIAFCLGLPDFEGALGREAALDETRRIAGAVRIPVSVVMGLTGSPMSVSQLEDLGVKRVSIGGSLARATLGLIRLAAAEIRDQGTFTYSEEQVPDAELCRFFATRQSPPLRS